MSATGDLSQEATLPRANDPENVVATQPKHNDLTYEEEMDQPNELPQQGMHDVLDRMEEMEQVVLDDPLLARA